MRELTEEERKLTPDWATHYWVSDEKIMFESQEHFQLLNSGSLSDRYDNAVGHVTNIAVELVKEPFDITSHDWSDCDIQCEVENGYIRFKSQTECDEFVVEKDDVIAMALHFGLTSDDLK